VQAWQLGFLERRSTRFRERVEEGRIRDGHGDLRLEHVYFEGAEPVVIDCVEFNDRLRSGDAAADVAFLAMELTARSRPDLAEAFLAAFALESDDHDLYGVVDFYAGYRAWVRGKVAAFPAADPTTPPEKAARKAEEARSLFVLARSYAEDRPGTPPVIAVGGLIGSGKSTLAEALGRAVPVPVISSDRVRKALAGVPATERAPASAYTAAFTARTFDEMLRRAGVVLDSGRGVVLTRPSGSGDSGAPPGTWPGAGAGGSSSSRRRATRPRSGSGCGGAPSRRPCRTPGNRSSSASARSSSPLPSSAPASTSGSTRRGRPRRPCVPRWRPSRPEFFPTGAARRIVAAC
jgi:hypothetical protein